MIKCPAPYRIVSQIVDARHRQEFLQNSSVIVLDLKNPSHVGYRHIAQQELSQTNWRLGPDPLWDMLWTKFRRKWRIVIGSVPFAGPEKDWIAKGAPVCEWIAVQFESDDEWMRFKMSAADLTLRNEDLREAENATPPKFDPNRMIPCPGGRRVAMGITDERLSQLSNSAIIYEREGCDGPSKCKRLTATEIGFERSLPVRGNVTPDPLFDFLYTKYRAQWHLYTNAISFMSNPRLAVAFHAEADLQDFLATWPQMKRAASEAK